MSASRERIEMKVDRDGDELVLRSPDVGGFTAALPRGAALAPGMVAGALHRLGRSTDLVVPAGAAGAITSDAPRAVVAPVGFGETLYRLDPSGAADGAAAGLASGALAVTAGQSGRVWHRPAPGEDVFCSPDDVLEDGAPVCLIEVMKTFSTVPYRAVDGLPGHARVVRWLVDDGADVQQGDPILEIEPA